MNWPPPPRRLPPGRRDGRRLGRQPASWKPGKAELVVADDTYRVECKLPAPPRAEARMEQVTAGFKALVCIALTSCITPGIASGKGWEDHGQSGADTVLLRTSPAQDSIVLRRDDFTILLSMRDIEYYSTIPRYDPRGCFAEFLTTIRRAYSANHGNLEQRSDLEDYLLADLLEAGKVAIRLESRGDYLAWVLMVRNRVQSGNMHHTGRTFYRPDGRILMRVIDSITRP